MQATVGAEAKDAAEYGCARQALLTRFHDNPFTQQLPVAPIAFADENPQPDSRLSVASSHSPPNLKRNDTTEPNGAET